MGKPQKVECPRLGWVPFLGFGVGCLGRFKPHQTGFLRVDRQSVLAHPLGQDIHDSLGVVFSWGGFRRMRLVEVIPKGGERDVALAAKVGLRQAAAAEITEDSIPA